MMRSRKAKSRVNALMDILDKRERDEQYSRERDEQKRLIGRLNAETAAAWMEKQGKDARDKNVKEADKINNTVSKRMFLPSRRNPLYDVSRGQMKKKRWAI